MESTITETTSARDFMCHVASKMNQKPSDVEKFIKILEYNWIKDVTVMKQVDDEQWKDLTIPMGLLILIKANLKMVGQ